MSDFYWLTDEQMDCLRPYFPKGHGKPRVDDQRVLSGILLVNRNGLGWRRGAKRYDRCLCDFFSAIALAATVIFWL